MNSLDSSPDVFKGKIGRLFPEFVMTLGSSVSGDTPSISTSSNRALIIWLGSLCLAIFTMIVVGGITRLTDSGLSMVEWRPLLGTLPPLNDAEWQRVFEAYKNYPQYQLVNEGMSLAAFKFIFFWEYGHRLLGRLIGLWFAVPFFYFLLTKQIPIALKSRLWIAFVIGGLQGLMGWYMVKSGLVDEPLVSHYRLAAHLSLALFLFAYIGWLVMQLLPLQKIEVDSNFNRLAYGFCLLLVVQIVYGAFVAGNRAGFGFNTYPMMNDSFLPDIALSLSPLWYNFLDNNAMLQFVHRWLGAAVLITTLLLVWQATKSGSTQLLRLSLALAASVILQFLLGVMTLINVVPLGLASVHQAGACLVVLVTVLMMYRTTVRSS